MRPVPAFSLHALGRTVRVLHGPGVPEEFLMRLRKSWADCLLTESDARSGIPASVRDATTEGAPSVRFLLTAVDEASEDGPGSSPEGLHRIPVGEREGWDRASQRFTSELTVALIRTYLAQDAADRPHLLHAAALMDPETGACAVLVGPSGRGKTTAALALGRTGLVYLSDETSAIHPGTLRLTPYPKPLSVIREPGLPKDQIAASALGLSLPRSTPAPWLAALVVLDRLQDAAVDDDVAEGLPRVRRLPLHLGLQTLAEQSSGTAGTPDGLERLAALTDRVGGILAVRYREAQTLPPLIRELLAPRAAGRGPEDDAVDEGSERGRSWTYHRPAMPADAAGGSSGGRWQRDPRTAAVDTADGMILLRGERSFTVSRVAADAWLRAEEPVDAATLAHHLEGLHGGAPEGALRTLLDTLVQEGLLRLVPSTPTPAQKDR